MSDSPTLHALFWGVAATWWAGLAVGLLVAAASRVGRLPKLSAAQQMRPAVCLMATMGTLALSAGVLAYFGSVGQNNGTFDRIFGDLPVPREKQAAFIADFAAHNVSYLVGFVGGVVTCLVTIVRRFRLRAA